MASTESQAIEPDGVIVSTEDPASGAAKKTTSLMLAEDGKSFCMAGKSGVVTVAVTVSRAEDVKLWPSLFQSRKFELWASQFENHSTFELTSVKVDAIYTSADGTNDITSALIVPSIKGGASHSAQPVLLKSEASVGVLVMLRLSMSSNNNDNGNNQHFRQQRGGDSFSRDFVLFGCKERASIGATSSLEILHGSFSPTGEFVCDLESDLHAALNCRIFQQDLVPLSKNRVSASSDGAYSPLEVYLYRQNIDESDFAKLPKTPAASRKPNSDPITPATPTEATNPNLRLTTLGEAWRLITDASTMATLFLVHEFRYHGIMPKYKPPRDAALRLVPVEKRKPLFHLIKQLDPHVVGVNLKAKIVSPLIQENIVETTKSGAKVNESRLSIGDATGCIDLKLEGDQLSIDGLFQAGTSLVIRNANIEVVDNFMVLTVNKWGKVRTPEADEEDGFDFTINKEHNVSTVEYERIPNAEGHNGGFPASNYRGYGRGGYNNNRGKGARRGRGGRRGGGGRPAATAAPQIAVA